LCDELFDLVVGNIEAVAPGGAERGNRELNVFEKAAPDGGFLGKEVERFASL
jgi:hypothetical protein